MKRAAIARLSFEELRDQQNINSILGKSIPYIEDSSTPENLDEDWLRLFFSKSKLYSDEQMQELWAKVLAGESNHSGSFSRRTILFLETLELEDAQMFTDLCKFALKIPEQGLEPFILHEGYKVYGDNNITFDTLKHLSSIGLIVYTPEGGGKYLENYDTSSIEVEYLSEKIKLKLMNGQRSLTIGSCMFTKVGKELASICNAPKVDGFLAILEELWRVERVFIDRDNESSN